MFGVGAPELIIIAVIALLVFGPSKLPEIGKTIGKGLREFKKASSDLKDQINPLNDIEEPKPEPKPKSITKGKNVSVKKPVRKKSTEKLNVSVKKTARTTKNKTSKKSNSHPTSPKSL